MRVTGALGALIFNASLIALPFSAAETWRAWNNGEIYTYAVTPQSIAATRGALDHAAAALTANASDRNTAWAELVAQELNEGDFRAAHGLLLASPAMLAPAEANKLQTRLPAFATDDQITTAALTLLPPDFAQGFQRPGAGDFLVVGDTRDLAIDAERWLQGQSVDELTLILSGIAAASPPDFKKDAEGGASVVKLTMRTGQLTEPLSAYLSNLTFAAAPPEQVKEAIETALASAQAGTEGNAVTEAFRASINPTEFQRLALVLADIRAVGAGAGADSAARLLTLARNGADLKRLRLIATSGGDRAALLFKRSDKDRLLDLARGNWAFSAHAMQALGAFALSLLGLLFSTLFGLRQMRLRREEQDLMPPPDPILASSALVEEKR